MHIKPLDKTNGYIMIDGNTAGRIGLRVRRRDVGALVSDHALDFVDDASRASATSCASIRQTGKKNFMIIQAEDELAAIGIVLGAAWNGARAFTPTKRPGHLTDERIPGARLLRGSAGGDFDVQRVGPSTGMPTRTQQADIMLCAYASHGDTRHVLLFPANPEECFYLTVKAFDLAERLQTPVMVLSDLDIGMNDWMCPDLEWDDSYKPDRARC